MGLGFKHGGDIVQLSKTELLAPCMCEVITCNSEEIIVRTLEDITESVHVGYTATAGSDLRFIVTTCCIISDAIEPGNLLNKGDLIMKKSEPKYPDDLMKKLYTITKTKYSGDLGEWEDSFESWSVNKGVIKYDSGIVFIGDVDYDLDQNQLYFYPEGVTVDVAQRISTGVPDMNELKKKCDDYGILYSIFYYYLKSIKDFETFNSEPFEILFKCIVDNEFNVDKAVLNDPEILNNLYYGSSVKVFQKMVSSAIDTQLPKYNKRVAELLNLMDDAKKSEIDSKHDSTANASTRRRINYSKNHKGGYDWKYIFNQMYAEAMKSGDKEVSWSWDKVRNNIRSFFDSNSKYQASNDSSINQLRTRYEITPEDAKEEVDEKEQAKLEVRLNELSELIDSISIELVNETDKDKIDKLMKEKNKLSSEKKSILSRSIPKNKEYWKKRLDKALNTYGKLTSSELKNELEVWLNLGKYGSPLKPYIKLNSRSLKLKIILGNLEDNEIKSIRYINDEITDLVNEQAKLNPENEEEKKRIDEIESEIKDLKHQRQELNVSTIAHTSLGKDSVLIPLILSFRDQ